MQYIPGPIEQSPPLAQRRPRPNRFTEMEGPQIPLRYRTLDRKINEQRCREMGRLCPGVRE